MAYVIGDSCISCGACAAQCPVSAIAEGDGKFEIDKNTCISCGSCAGDKSEYYNKVMIVR